MSAVGWPLLDGRYVIALMKAPHSNCAIVHRVELTFIVRDCSYPEGRSPIPLRCGSFFAVVFLRHII
jgi:hypothetical protein